MLQTLMLLVIIFVAVIIQATTGFGFAVIVMSVLPILYTVVESMVLKSSINVLTVTYVAYTYRHHINYKLLALPVISSLIFNYGGVAILGRIDNDAAMLWLGILLVSLSLYFFFFSERIHMPVNAFTAILCGSISGLMGGMIGVGGPPIVLYYSVAIKEKKAYMGTIQSFFAINAVLRLFFFAATVTIDLSVLKILPFAIVTSLVAAYLGNHIYKKMPANIIRKVIYALMGIAGIYYMFK